LISERDPYDVDMDAIIAAARERGCYLELNADPDRLDLNDIHVHAAKVAGVKVAISTDAHSIGGFANIRFGVDQARRGWLEADDVINSRPLAQLQKLLKR
jgi:DNA polymerase (family 10)